MPRFFCQDGQICLLAVFAHGGTTEPQVTSCLTFGDIYAIGASLQQLTNRTTSHGRDIRQVHGFTDDAEKLGFATVSLGIIEITGLINGALLALKAKCRRRVVASTDGEENAVALSRMPLGTSREAPGSAQPTTSDATSPRDVLLGMQDTAIWISNGVICAKPSHEQSGMVK